MQIERHQSFYSIHSTDSKSNDGSRHTRLILEREGKKREQGSNSLRIITKRTDCTLDIDIFECFVFLQYIQRKNMFMKSSATTPTLLRAFSFQSKNIFKRLEK